MHLWGAAFTEIKNSYNTMYHVGIIFKFSMIPKLLQEN